MTAGEFAELAWEAVVEFARDHPLYVGCLVLVGVVLLVVAGRGR